MTQRLLRPEPAEFCDPALFVENVLCWLARLVCRLSDVGDGDPALSDGSVFVGVTKGFVSEESVVPE